MTASVQSTFAAGERVLPTVRLYHVVRGMRDGMSKKVLARSRFAQRMQVMSSQRAPTCSTVFSTELLLHLTLVVHG